MNTEIKDLLIESGFTGVSQIKSELKLPQKIFEFMNLYSGLTIKPTPYIKVKFLNYEDELFQNSPDLAEIINEDSAWYIGNYNNEHGMLFLTPSGKSYSIDVECSFVVLFSDSSEELFHRLFISGDHKKVNGKTIHWPIEYDEEENLFKKRETEPEGGLNS